jgi:hypothetical protein
MSAALLLGLFLKCLASAVGEEVVLGATVVLAESSFGTDAGGALETLRARKMERGSTRKTSLLACSMPMAATP